MSAAARHTFDPGVTWAGWHAPTGLELAIVAVMGLAMLWIAILEFQRMD